jgi:hypothetical protein
MSEYSSHNTEANQVEKAAINPQKTQTTSSPIPNTPPVSNKPASSQSKFVLISVGAVLLILLIFVGGSWLFKQSNTISTKPTVPNAQNPAVPVTDTTSVVPVDPAFAQYEALGIAQQGQFIRSDADGDAYPDWVETNMQTNPQVAECFDILSDCGAGAAFKGQEFDRQNVIIVLDSSGSMNAKSGSQTRMDLAKEAVLSYAARFENSSVNVGLVVYGHTGNNTEVGKTESCKGISEIYTAQPIKVSDFQSTLLTFKPTGWTPIAESLRFAEAKLKAIPGVELEKSSILLVTDGEETCGGNPQAVAEEISNSGLQVVIDVVALETDDAANAQLKPIADAGKGVFIAVKNAQDLKDKLYQEFKKAQKVNSTTISCTSKVIRDFTACRTDGMDKLYAYIDQVKATESATGISPLQTFLINFDKTAFDVHQSIVDKTKETTDRVAELQKQAADQYSDNAEEFTP